MLLQKNLLEKKKKFYHNSNAWQINNLQIHQQMTEIEEEYRIKI